jgi:hypothetical protein
MWSVSITSQAALAIGTKEKRSPSANIVAALRARLTWLSGSTRLERKWSSMDLCTKARGFSPLGPQWPTAPGWRICKSFGNAKSVAVSGCRGSPHRVARNATRPSRAGTTRCVQLGFSGAELPTRGMSRSELYLTKYRKSRPRLIGSHCLTLLLDDSEPMAKDSS